MHEINWYHVPGKVIRNCDLILLCEMYASLHNKQRYTDLDHDFEQ